MEQKIAKMNEILVNPEVQAQLRTAEGSEEIYKIFVENGVDFTPEEFEQVLITIGRMEATKDGELSEEDLDEVAGGIWEALAALVTGPIGTGVLIAAGCVCLVAAGVGAYNKYKELSNKFADDYDDYIMSDNCEKCEHHECEDNEEDYSDSDKNHSWKISVPDDKNTDVCSQLHTYS